jgi:hypothetical protein
MNPNYFTPIPTPKFICEKCDFKCCKKSDFERHLLTNKHKNQIKPNDLTQKNAKQYSCKCGKIYKHMSTLCTHKKKCINKEETPIVITTELIMELIKNNQEMKNIILEQNKLIELSSEKSITNNTTNNNNINNTTNNNTTTNNAFNLNFFLNETCKDAMNITDFVSSIKLSLEDLENTGKQGYIKGISDIIVKNLNNLEQCFRPIHCSDMKREVFYIKENNKWEKETEDNPILTKAIKLVANENIKQIKYWRDKNPDCTDSNSKKNNLYLKIVSNSMNGLTKEEGEKNINKIISNVAKEVVINKVSC